MYAWLTPCLAIFARLSPHAAIDPVPPVPEPVVPPSPVVEPTNLISTAGVLEVQVQNAIAQSTIDGSETHTGLLQTLCFGLERDEQTQDADRLDCDPLDDSVIRMHD